MASLGDLSEDKVKQAPPTATPVPYIDIGSIDRSTKCIGETTLVSRDDAPTRARQWVRDGDVLVSMTRPNLNAVAQVGADLDGAVASTGFDVLRARHVVSKWIFYRVRSNEFVTAVCEDLQGVVYPAIRPHDVRRHELPLPPLREQHRVIEAIESYFTRLEDVVASLERVERNLKRYRASVLKAAVEGRLVPTEAELARNEGRPVEPPFKAALPSGLSNTRRRAGRLWGGGVVPSLTNEEKARLPTAWRWAKVADLGADPDDVVQVGPMSMRSNEFEPVGVPVLNVGCVQWDRFDESKLNYLPADRARSFSRYRIKPGDVLFTRSGTVGRCAVAQPHHDGWLMTFHLLRARPDPSLCLPEYLRMVLEGAPHIRRQTKEASIGTTRSGFNTRLLATLDIPLPPLAEQVRIVEAATTILSVLDVLREGVRSDELRVIRLRQSILKWAFEGRLVDQDPSDEPASVLLERIRAERESAGAETRATRRSKRKGHDPPAMDSRR